MVEKQLVVLLVISHVQNSREGDFDDNEGKNHDGCQFERSEFEDFDAGYYQTQADYVVDYHVVGAEVPAYDSGYSDSQTQKLEDAELYFGYFEEFYHQDFGSEQEEDLVHANGHSQTAQDKHENGQNDSYNFI